MTTVNKKTIKMTEASHYGRTRRCVAKTKTMAEAIPMVKLLS